MNNFEEYLQQADSNMAEPPAGHLRRFEQRINSQSSGKSILLFYRIGYAAAILILIAVLAVRIHDQNRETELILATQGEELVESELYLKKIANEKIIQIKASGASHKEFTRVIREFDKSLQNLKKDLEEAPGDKRVVEAVFNTYMLKIETLDNLLSIYNTVG
ncbi:MAG: hypothetical protein IPM71_00780 [Bacteroidota bacterium]|nr:MAG: hypothetical protein IPM71_00780 [Bacteroidota bacterium]